MVFRKFEARQIHVKVEEPIYCCIPFHEFLKILQHRLPKTVEFFLLSFERKNRNR